MDKPEKPTDQPLEFDGLPERPDPSSWIAETPGEPVPDPNGGRDPETDFMLRWA